MPDLPLPRGVRDLMPNEALFRSELIKKIESVFQTFGFLTIDTPSLESLAVLKAKGGIGEDAKLIFEIKDDDIGLRFENTMSLARYIVMHQELPLPFKRYYIGKVWRREEPQRLRYREFTQADADIVGGIESYADAEIIALGATLFERIGIEYRIEVNHREILEKCLLKLGVAAGQILDVMRILDKLEKVGDGKTSEMLRGISIPPQMVMQIMQFINMPGDNEQKLDYIDNLLGDKASTTRLRETFALIALYHLSGELRFNPSIMRGLDYYTGIVFEYKAIEDDSTSLTLMGGGRYDKLIGMLGGKSLPAVGFGMGLDRILDELDFSSSEQYTYARVIVTYIKPANYRYALSVANRMRAAGIPTDINISDRNISNQLAYAASVKARYALIIGDAEQAGATVKVRNLLNGNENMLSVDDAVKVIKGDEFGKV